MDREMRRLEIGKAELLRERKDIVLVGIGHTIIPALKTAQDLSQLKIEAAVVNARFVKPLDRELLLELLARIPNLITVENHVLDGSFGNAVLELLADESIADIKVRRL